MADSIDQSQSRGEIFQVHKAGVVDDNKIFELGKVIKDKVSRYGLQASNLEFNVF